LRDHSAERNASKRVGCCEGCLEVLAADIFISRSEEAAVRDVV
jgi:hypothetical protein